MKRSESISKIAPALLKAQQDMGNAKKDSKNPFYKSSYADLNSVREVVTDPLHQNGVSILQLNTPGESGRNFVTTVLLHISGEFISSDTEIICKEANNPQALGSAISYARRYGLSSMLSVGAEDDDGNAASNIKRKSEIVSNKPLEHAVNQDSSAGEYVIQVGQKLKGKKLREVSMSELISFAKWLEESAKQQNRSISASALEFISALQKYKATAA
jgi:hypothetical protein